MKRFDCIIFDFDGTLADTAAGILATVKETFRRLGFSGASDERIRPTIGLVLEQSLQQIGDLTEAQTRDAARLYREIFPEFGEVNSSLFPGVTETLGELHARGYRMAIATSRGRESLEAIMAPYGVNGYFEEMVTATDRLAPKPAPDMVLTDGNMTLDIAFPQRSIVKGDARVYSIGAASILAKVYRDALMADYAAAYPGYGFERNAGYGTKEHIQAIREVGICPIHRRTFVTKFWDGRERPSSANT